MTKKKVFKIIGMHCTSCCMLIDGDLEETKGVFSAKTHYAKQITEVIYNDEEIAIEEIMKVVRKTGYEVS